MGLALTLNEIAYSSGIDSNSGLIRRTAYGRDVSISEARFCPSYASVPHALEGEELSQLTHGRLSVFMDGIEFKLQPGDFIRIPPMTVHWKKNLSDTEAVMLELHNPPLSTDQSQSLLDELEREDASYGRIQHGAFARTYIASRFYADNEANFPEATLENTPLLFRSASAWAAAPHLELDRVYCSEGTNKMLRVGGESMAIMYSERLGLKARPHFHAAEQISYIVEGELWTFLDDRVIHSRAGDVVRIPGNAVHWALVKAGHKAVTFEVHTPLQGDPVSTRGMQWLLPQHRLPALNWIPGGFSTDALAADLLVDFEVKTMAADAERQRLEALHDILRISHSGRPR